MVEYQIAVVGYGGIDNSFYDHLMDLKDGKTPRQILKKVLKEQYGKYFTDDKVYEFYLDFVEYYHKEFYAWIDHIWEIITRLFDEIFHSLLNIANRIYECFKPAFESLANLFNQIEEVCVDDIDYGSVCVRTAKVRTKRDSYYMSTFYSANLNGIINQTKRRYQYCRRNF